jgi:hypothetical protein
MFMVHAAAIFTLYYTKNYFTNVFYLLKICKHLSLFGHNVSGAIVDSTSQFFRPPCWYYRRPQWHNVHNRFHPNPSSDFRVESCERMYERTDGRTTDTQTLRAPYTLMLCTPWKERKTRKQYFVLQWHIISLFVTIDLLHLHLGSKIVLFYPYGKKVSVPVLTLTSLELT